MKRSSKRVKGSVLFLTLILSLIGLILISGLFMAYYRMLKVIFPVRIYSNVREAASGTVTLLASYVDKGTFSRIDQEECPSGTKDITQDMSNSSAVRCCQAEIKFRLVGYTDVFPAKATVCLLGISSLAGYSASPVVGGGGMTLRLNCDNTPCLYSITTTAFGPQGTSSYVESLYVK